MNLIRTVLKYDRTSMLHWITFDTESGQMIDCSIHPSHKERDIFAAQHWSVKDNKLVMTPKSGIKRERPIETLTEIKIGEDNVR